MNYYNEFDPHAAAWLRQLIADGLIPPGDVDERSIEDVTPDDVAGYRQCHWFAGIGGWPIALRLAGWPDDRPVWTGSCPCQPFSVAGALRGEDDPRSLWWAFRWLIDQCGPAVCFGEQVASRAGRNWLAAVRADLEALGYDVGAADLCAAGVGAPHIRQRLYWVADGQRPGLEGHVRHGDDRREPGRIGSIEAGPVAKGGGAGRLEHAHGAGPQPGRTAAEAAGHGAPAVAAGGDGGVANADGRDACAEREQRGGQQRQQPQDGGSSGLADTSHGRCGEERADGGGRAVGDREEGLPAGRGASGGDLRPDAVHGGWADADWLYCRDGKWRPVKRGLEPLVAGIPRGVGYSGDPRESVKATQEARVMRLRGYGNSVVPQVAAAFVMSVT